jgi:hypothetical protein
VNEHKLYEIMLSQITLEQQGLPNNSYLNKIIIEATNLLQALKFVGCTATDTLQIENRLDAMLGFWRATTRYTQNIFNGYFQTIA